MRPRRNIRQLVKSYMAGPLTGLRDSLDPKISSDPKRAVTVQNMYPLELDKPSSFVGRPGFAQGGSQLGASGKRTGQFVDQFTKLDGTEYTVAVVGGQGIYTYDWSTEAWTLVVTVANLTTASITLSETARVYGVTFNDTLVLSDGVNTPFTWDGTSGAGGLTELTNAPVFYGQPVVYSAKLWGIKNTERNVAVWSEENAANTGYEAGGYNNAWQLGQTDQEALVALVPTNDAIYYARAESWGKITGSVTPDFQNDRTQDGVDPEVGTTSPAGVLYYDKRIFFSDSAGRPHMVAGGSVEDISHDVLETVRGMDRSELAQSQTLYDDRTGLVLFAVVELGQSDLSALIAFNPELDVPVAVWRGFTFQRIGVVKDGDGRFRLMHLASDGYAYIHGHTDGDVWSDGLNSGTLAINHGIETCHLGVDSRYEKQFVRADVLLRADADASAISLSHETPYGSSSTQTASVSGSGARWDVPDWDDFAWGYDTVERHKAFGLLAHGRWIRLRISHEVAGERFGFESAEVEYVAAGDAAAAA